MSWLIFSVLFVMSALNAPAADDLDSRRQEVLRLVESGVPLSEIQRAVEERHALEDLAISQHSGVEGQLAAASEPYVAELRAARAGSSSVWGIPTDEKRRFVQDVRTRTSELASSAWTASLTGKDRETRTLRATAAGLRAVAMLDAIRDNAKNDDWLNQLQDTKQLLEEAIELAQGPRGLIFQSAAIVAAAQGDLQEAKKLLTQARSESQGLDALTLTLIEASIASGGIGSKERILAANTIAQEQLTPSQRLFLMEWLLRATAESGASREVALDRAASCLRQIPIDDRRLLIRPVAELVQRLPGSATEHPLEKLGRGRRLAANGELDSAREEFLAVGSGTMPSLQPEAWYELAQLELAAKDTNSATKALLEAIASQPSHPSAQQAARLAIRIAQANGSHVSTTQSLLTALPNHPDRYQWRVILGTHAWDQHRLQDALEMWRSIPKIAPESVEARRLAAEVLLGVPQSQHKHSNEAMRAVEAFEESLQVHAEERLLFLAKILRIRALLTQDRSTEAARLSEAFFAIEAIPTDLRPRAISVGLEAFRSTYRDEDATRLLQSFAKTDPEGNALFAREQLKQGARVIRELLANGELDQARAIALRLNSDGAVPQQSTIEANIENDPWQAIEASMVLRLAGNARGALAAANSVLKLHPEATEAVMEKAEALTAHGDPAAYEEALILFKRLRPGVERGSRNWWICELRQLEILEHLEVNLHLIGPRIKRLRQVDPNLGDQGTRRALESLQARVDRRVPETPEN